MLGEGGYAVVPDGRSIPVHRRIQDNGGDGYSIFSLHPVDQLAEKQKCWGKFKFIIILNKIITW